MVRRVEILAQARAFVGFNKLANQPVGRGFEHRLKYTAYRYGKEKYKREIHRFWGTF